MNPHRLFAFATAFFALPFVLCGQSPKVTKHENVVYAMVSGTALLMDVYQPERSNSIGLVFISGSGFGIGYTRGYDDTPLKDDYFLDTAYVGKIAAQLVEKGYTVFSINHRFAPLFHFPEIFYDCQRAVRFIRFNAKKYGIDPNHIGALGHSSGANLASMLGVTDTVITNLQSNPIDSYSSKVQAVVSLAAGSFILSDFSTKADTAINNNLESRIVLNYIGDLPSVSKGEFVLSGRYAEASPITYVSKDDAAFLIYASDNDPFIPTRQAERMYKKLIETGVASRIIIVPKSGHHPIPDLAEIDRWFQKYLK